MYSYIVIFICVLIPLYISWYEENICNSLYSRNKGDTHAMEKLLQELVGKNCLITTLKGDFSGKLTFVDSTSIILEKKDNKEFINLEFVVSAKPLPLNKKGKTKLFYF